MTALWNSRFFAVCFLQFKDDMMRYCIDNICLSLFQIDVRTVVMQYLPPTNEGSVFTSVCHSVRDGWVCLVPGPFRGVYQGGYTRGGIPGVGMYTPTDLVYPRPPSPGSGLHNTYGWQANGTHPTGMLSSS